MGSVDSSGQRGQLMSFFAHLVAGPIVRGSELLPQFQRPARLNKN